MCAQVGLIRGTLGEALVAQPALVRLLLHVDTQVAGQRGGPGEGLAAVRAKVRLFARV